MRTSVEHDASNRIVISKELGRAAGIAGKRKLVVHATPGRIVLEVKPNASGRIFKCGKQEVRTRDVPTTPIKEAVEISRHHGRFPDTAIIGAVVRSHPEHAVCRAAVEELEESY